MTMQDGACFCPTKTEHQPAVERFAPNAWAFERCCDGRRQRNIDAMRRHNHWNYQTFSGATQGRCVHPLVLRCSAFRKNHSGRCLPELLVDDFTGEKNGCLGSAFAGIRTPEMCS